MAYFSRVVGVFNLARQVCFQVVGVHVLALFDGGGGMADGVAVFDDVFALGKVSKGNFMAKRNVVEGGNLALIPLDGLPFCKRVHGNGHIIGRVDAYHSCSFVHCNVLTGFQLQCECPRCQGGPIARLPCRQGRARSLDRCRPKMRCSTARRSPYRQGRAFAMH